MQGYHRFRCLECAKQFNERSAGLLNRTQYPSDVIALVVLWQLRYKLSLRDLAEMFLIRDFVFSYEAVRDWEAKLSPALAKELRRRRKGKVGRSWYVDETYIRVHGCWKYLYRAIDRDGALVEVMLSEHRDLAAAKAFFRSAKTVTGVTPNRVTTDGHDAYPRAIRTELGKRVRHRTNRYLTDVFDKLFLLIGEILFLARVTAWRRAGLGRKSVTLPRMGVSHLPRPCALAACEDAPQFARGFSDAVRLGASSVVCQAS